MRPRFVRAAGGVVMRQGEQGPQVAVVHRPRYDDWSLPKGKRDPGETDEQCAVREVEEETGLRCALGRELLPTRYVDRKGRAKVVRYWDMKVLGFRPFVANDEIDQLEWLSFADAVERLSYPYDADVVSNVRLSFTSRSPTSC
jgi:8-oxo-dGTP diphosphatase